MNIDVTWGDNINRLIDGQKKYQETIKETIGEIKNFNDHVISNVSGTSFPKQLVLDTERAKSSLRDLRKQLSDLENRQSTANGKDKLAIQEQIDSTKESIIQTTVQLKKLEAQTKEYYRIQKQLISDQNKLANESNKSTGGFIQSWGKYLLRYYVAFQGIQMAMQSISNAYNTLKDFEYAMAGVKAVSGATASEFENLKQKAIALSGTTLFNAVDIAKLEEVYSKAGFTIKQIAAMIEPTLKTATATDDSLENTSELLGGIINGFKLNADNTKHIADVMGLAFNKSMLDLSKFKESMKYVGNIAAEAGFSFEEVSAILMVASNNMMSGSMAGTALRQVFNSMLNPTSKFSKAIGGTVYGLEGFMNALKGLKEKGADLGTMFQITDKRAANLFNIMMNNTDQLKLFTEQAKNANGEMDKMAAIKMDTLTGQTARFNGEWQKLILTMGKGTGFFKKIMGGLADAINIATAGSLRYNESLVLINNQQVKQRKHISDSLEVYESLAKKVGKTVVENNKLSTAISTLQLYFDDNIIKINKETGEYNINTTAIENNLKARNKLLFGVGGEKDKIINDYTDITRARTQIYVDLEKNYAKLKKTYSLLSKEEKGIVNKPQSKISDRGTPTVTVGRFKNPESSTKYSDVLQGYIDDYKLQNNLISKWDKLVLDASAKEKEFTESGFGQVKELIKKSKQLTSQIQAEIKTPEQIAAEAKAAAEKLKKGDKELIDEQKKELTKQLKDQGEYDKALIEEEQIKNNKLLEQQNQRIEEQKNIGKKSYEEQLSEAKEYGNKLILSNQEINQQEYLSEYNDKLNLIERLHYLDQKSKEQELEQAKSDYEYKNKLDKSAYDTAVKIAKTNNESTKVLDENYKRDRLKSDEDYFAKKNDIINKYLNIDYKIPSISESLKKQLDDENKDIGKVFEDEGERLQQLWANNVKEIIATNKEKKEISFIGNLLGLDNKEDDKILTQQLNDFTTKFQSYVDQWVEGYQKVVDAKNRMVDEAQAALDTELELSKQGYASNVTLKKKELQYAKEARDQSLKEQREAYKIQMGLEAALQIAQTISAVISIYANAVKSKGLLGILTGTAGVIGLLVLINSYKAKVRSTYERGGMGVLQGKSHAEGGISFGDGLEAQGGESWAIFNRNATNKNLPLIRNMVYALNNDKIVINKDVATKLGDTTVVYDSPYMKRIYDYISANKTESKVEYGDGFRIEHFGNHTKKIFYN